MPTHPRPAEPAEDLPPDGQVPVAEGGAGRGSADRPRAASQHAVVAAEERGAVGGVEHPLEARPGLEPARGPLPDLPHQLLDAVGGRPRLVGAHRCGSQCLTAEIGQGGRPLGVAPWPPAPAPLHGVPGTRLLPLLLGGQPGPRPGCVGLGLEEADVLHGLVGRDLLDVAEPGARTVRGPEQRSLQTSLHPVAPAPLGPPPRLVVATCLDERLPLGVRHRHAGDPEGGQVHGVGGALVVQRPGLVRRRRRPA